MRTRFVSGLVGVFVGMLCLQACGSDDSEQRLTGLEKRLEEALSSRRISSFAASGKKGQAARAVASKTEAMHKHIKPMFDELRNHPHRRLGNGDVVYALDDRSGLEAVLSGSTDRPRLAMQARGTRDVVVLAADLTVPSLSATVDFTKLAQFDARTRSMSGIMVLTASGSPGATETVKLEFPQGLHLTGERRSEFELAATGPSTLIATVTPEHFQATITVQALTSTKPNGERIQLPAFDGRATASLNPASAESEDPAITLTAHGAGTWKSKGMRLAWIPETRVALTSVQGDEDQVEVEVLQGALDVKEGSSDRTYHTGERAVFARDDVESLADKFLNDDTLASNKFGA